MSRQYATPSRKSSSSEKKKRGNGRSAGKIDDRQTEVRLASQLLVSSNNLAVATIKRPLVVSVVPVSGRNFRTKSRKEVGEKKRERDEGNTAEKAKSGSPRHVNDRPGVNCGGGSLVVSGDDYEHKRDKHFRKHAEVLWRCRRKEKLVKYFRLCIRARPKAR